LREAENDAGGDNKKEPGFVFPKLKNVSPCSLISVMKEKHTIYLDLVGPLFRTSSFHFHSSWCTLKEAWC